MTTLTEFRAGDIRGDFRDALHALSSARSRLLLNRSRRRLPTDGGGGDDEDGGELAEIHAVEVAIGDVAVQAARFDMQTGTGVQSGPFTPLNPIRSTDLKASSM